MRRAFMRPVLRPLMRLVFVALAAPAATFGGCDCAGEPLENSRAIIQVQELLDFGPIGQGTSVAESIVVENGGAGELDLTAVLGDGTSPDFVLENGALKIDPRTNASLPVRFSPSNVGEDSGSVVISSNDPQRPEVTVLLHGGPIEPELTTVDELDFSFADVSVVALQVIFTNTGLATLQIESAAIDPLGNPQFAAPDAPFDVDILPAASIAFDVEYSRSTRSDDGRLLIRTNDPDDAPTAGVRSILLHPGALGQCEDGDDNDGDLLVDLEDPGCSGAADDTEQNGVDCVDGATRICGTDVGECVSGEQTCVGGVFETVCPAPFVDATAETCDGEDDDCDGTVDNGVTQACVDANACPGIQTCVVDGAGTFGSCVKDDPGCGPQTCDPDGSWSVAAPISYSCCFGLVGQTITSFAFSGDGTFVNGAPSGLFAPGTATCPTGSLSFEQLITGGCTETYTLDGTFTDADTFTGTYTMAFVGQDCDCFGSPGEECITQIIPVTATR